MLGAVGCCGRRIMWPSSQTVSESPIRSRTPWMGIMFLYSLETFYRSSAGIRIGFFRDGDYNADRLSLISLASECSKAMCFSVASSSKEMFWHVINGRVTTLTAFDII